MRHLIQGSSSHIPLADESVQCVVTSPPYWGLRQYAGEQIVPEWGCALGLEPTPELYVEHMVAIFREVRRVLRKDGTLWLNLGDSYAGGGQGPTGHNGIGDQERRQGYHSPGRKAPSGVKPKDLVGIPWMVAFALRADGWYLRSDIIWAKPNPMPESVTDRPTKAHEYLFLLTKRERYHYDADAIREPVAASSLARVAQNDGHPKFDSARERRADGHISGRDTLRADQLVPANGRNARTVWTIATQPYKGAHFATYPEDLVEPCILAGTSPKACGVCGAPWERVTERTGWPDPDSNDETQGRTKASGEAATDTQRRKELSGARHAAFKAANPDRFIGWRSTCEHEDDTGSCVVLDPFNGSGTTGRSAIRHGRSYVGIDISSEYLVEQASKRIDNIQHVMGL